MNRMLKVAFAGISLAISVSLGALALALPSLAHAGPNTVVSRSYAWSADHLTLEVPANVSYHPGPVWHVTITGPEQTLDQLQVENGRIGARQHSCFSLIPFCIGFGSDIDHTVSVAITGPALRQITIDGSGRVDLSGLNQDRLGVQINGSGTVHAGGAVQQTHLDIAGSGTIVLDDLRQNRLTARIGGSGIIEGSGATQNLEAHISGMGNIRLGQLGDQNAEVSVSGAGNVNIAPTQSASIRLTGAGDVHLTTQPRSLVTHVTGAGTITEGSPARSVSTGR